MENDYRITKLHGTLIGDNRIPELPDSEKTKVFSSTNGKTAWVDLPTDVGKDANGFAVLCHDGVEITGQKKSVKLADVHDNGAIIGRDQTASAPQTNELITKAYADKEYGRLDSANEWAGVNFFNNELHVNHPITNTSGMDLLYAGSDLSSSIFGESFKRVTGFACVYQFNTVNAVEGLALVATDATSQPTLSFISTTGKTRWFDISSLTPVPYDYQLPKKSGTIALTSDLSEAGTSVTIRRW